MIDSPTTLGHRHGSEPVARVSTPQAIVNRIADEILDGNLAPGEELREAELSERLGVSRPSIREAVADLSHRGLVEKRPHRSMRVTKLSIEDARDVFRVRVLLECEAIRAVAETPSTWAMMDEAVDRLEALSPGASWSSVASADLALHQALVDAAGSMRLSRAHGVLMNEMLLLLAPGRHYAGRDEMVAEHKSLIEAVKDGKPDLAVERMKKHLADGLGTIIEHLDQR